MAGIAGLAQLQAMISGYPPWIVFIGWVAYSIAARLPMPGLQTLASLIAGATAGCLVAWIVTIAPVPAILALPVTVAIAVGLIALLERARYLNAVPIYYLGMISFFASGAQHGIPILMTLAPPAAVGVCCGWLAGKLLAKFTPSSAAAHETPIGQVRHANHRKITKGGNVT